MRTQLRIAGTQTCPIQDSYDKKRQGMSPCCNRMGFRKIFDNLPLFRQSRGQTLCTDVCSGSDTHCAGPFGNRIHLKNPLPPRCTAALGTSRIQHSSALRHRYHHRCLENHHRWSRLFSWCWCWCWLWRCYHGRRRHPHPLRHRQCRRRR